MSRYIGIDPGPVESGYVVIDDGEIVIAGKIPNSLVAEFLRENVQRLKLPVVGIERIVPYSGRVDNNMEETYWFIGHLVHMCRESGYEPHVFRKSDWARWLTDSSHAKDGDVRMAIVNRWADGDLASYRKGGKFESLKNSDIRSAFGVAKYVEHLEEEVVSDE